jgi:hypothetical protein
MLGAADADRPLPWLRQWSQVQLRRAWVWYWKGQLGEIERFIAQVGPYIQRPGLALERSLYYQVLATRELRRHRYVASDELVEYARGALSAAQEADSAPDRVFGRFMVGFALLLQGRLEDATRHLANARDDARDVGDVASEVRCLAYLAIAARRALDVTETRKWSDEVLSTGTSAGMNDYAAIGQAGSAWVAWKGGDAPVAQTACQAALDAWARSPAPFPFQWIARLTLLALNLDEAPVNDVAAAVKPLLDPGQARLPDAIDSALQVVVAAHDGGDVKATRGALAALRAAALELHFL